MTQGWQFGHLQPLAYDMMMVDPPWKYKNWSAKGELKNASQHYPCMTLEELKQMRVGELASRNAVLWLWATNPLLRDAFELMETWGFKFKTAGHWVKRTKNWKLGFGPGYILRTAGEPFLIGTIGRPEYSKSVRSVIEGRLRGHSRKPDEAYEAAEKLYPAALRRVDVFSRVDRSGWECWGNEAGKFNETREEQGREILPAVGD
jgi:N6-adenosine-specific RNA methylase IME4